MGLPVYIATQGPLDNTIPEFWHTAKQENCSAIISLTKPIEAGRVKKTLICIFCVMFDHPHYFLSFRLSAQAIFHWKLELRIIMAI